MSRARLPLECIHLICEMLVADWDSRTLSVLLRVNKDFQAVALPLLYRDPLAFFYQSGNQARVNPYRRFGVVDAFALVRLLLLCVKNNKSAITPWIRAVYAFPSITPPTSKASIKAPEDIVMPRKRMLSLLTMDDNFPQQPYVDYLSYVHAISLGFYQDQVLGVSCDFATKLQQFNRFGRHEVKDMLKEDPLYCQLKKGDRPSKRDIRHFKKCLTADVLWALHSDRPEQMRRLTFHIQDIQRYQGIINRFKELKYVEFVTDIKYRSPIPSDETAEFIKRHTKSSGTLEEVYRSFQLGPPSSIASTHPLPLLVEPRVIDGRNWMRVCSRLGDIDFRYVKEINEPDKMEPSGLEEAIDQYGPYLHKCRSLESFKRSSFDETVDSFLFAVKEKDAAGFSRERPNTPRALCSDASTTAVVAMKPKAIARTPATFPTAAAWGVGAIIRQGHDRDFTLNNQRVMLKHVNICGSSRVWPWLNDVVYAFSETLETIYVDEDRCSQSYFEENCRYFNPTPTLLYLGRQWSPLNLRRLELFSHWKALFIDPRLLSQVTLLEHLVLEDYAVYTADFFLHAVKDLPPRTIWSSLKNLKELRLRGFPVYEFHPDSLEHMLKLEVLCLDTHCPSSTPEGMPSIKQPIPQMAEYLRNREMWNWQWQLPQLSFLELDGEFAWGFQFKMLQHSPKIHVLHLNLNTRYIRTDVSSRDFKSSLFQLDDDPIDLSSLSSSLLLPTGAGINSSSNGSSSNSSSSSSSGSNTKQLLSLPNLHYLELRGLWVLEQKELDRIFLDVMPNLRGIHVEQRLPKLAPEPWIQSTMKLKHLRVARMKGALIMLDFPFELIGRYGLQAYVGRCIDDGDICPSPQTRTITIETILGQENYFCCNETKARPWPGRTYMFELAKASEVEYVFGKSRFRCHDATMRARLQQGRQQE
ncbi:hypothetical protein BCR41DRAFT_360084 [Lobosporangium transversale]|uniref:Uncharacterized protein n=1 Tax=Lobosporangium transversale TaxID=64571 RepID=A0A1Y2GD22_9FUNG|nr:hypothetical protein BCR41DRAFT_360084 [Lobosporangium transversale]ORZ07488.1 hypothetical protein BCR41DRAFT_360084 [Lobosporangium transversale]|eukprot:XP_021877995.1 hypothetical protein BCR41DRAFT_360084 [Lobosporangium transversale]